MCTWSTYTYYYCAVMWLMIIQVIYNISFFGYYLKVCCVGNLHFSWVSLKHDWNHRVLMAEWEWNGLLLLKQNQLQQKTRLIQEEFLMKISSVIRTWQSMILAFRSIVRVSWRSKTFSQMPNSSQNPQGATTASPDQTKLSHLQRQDQKKRKKKKVVLDFQNKTQEKWRQWAKSWCNVPFWNFMAEFVCVSS